MSNQEYTVFVAYNKEKTRVDGEDIPLQLRQSLCTPAQPSLLGPGVFLAPGAVAFHSHDTCR
jgi:hypothetical protein